MRLGAVTKDRDDLAHHLANCGTHPRQDAMKKATVRGVDAPGLIPRLNVGQSKNRASRQYKNNVSATKHQRAKTKLRCLSLV